MNQKGSILIYILIAIFLTGVLIASMTQGAKKSASSEQVNEMMMYLQADIRTIQSNITECVVSYQNNTTGCMALSQNSSLPGSSCVNGYQSQDSGNYNVPFPKPSTLLATGSGTALASITCPRAPAGQQIIFTDSISQSLRLLQDTSNYTVTYYNNSTDGVYFRITRVVTDPLWTEVLNRLPSKYQSCSSMATFANPDPTGANCSAGCFYYFILHPGSAGSPVFGACP